MTRQTTTLTLAAAIGTTYADAVITYGDEDGDGFMATYDMIVPQDGE